MVGQYKKIKRLRWLSCAEHRPFNFFILANNCDLDGWQVRRCPLQFVPIVLVRLLTTLKVLLKPICTNCTGAEVPPAVSRPATARGDSLAQLASRLFTSTAMSESWWKPFMLLTVRSVNKPFRVFCTASMVLTALNYHHCFWRAQPLISMPFQGFLRRPSPLNAFWWSDHCHQCFFNDFLTYYHCFQ